MGTLGSDHVQDQRRNNVGGVTGKGFLPGHSGNPGGRPAGRRSIAAVVQQLLEANDEAEKLALAQDLIRQAKGGNGTVVRELLNRLDGPVTQRVVVELSETQAMDELIAVLGRQLSEAKFEDVITEWETQLRSLGNQSASAVVSLP